MKTTRKNIALGSLCIAVNASLLLLFQAGCPRSGAVPSPDAENRPMPWTSRRAITPGSTEAFISPGSTEVFVPTGRQMPPSRKGAKQRLPEQAMIQTLPTHPEVQAVDPDYVKLLQKKLEIATQQYDSVRAKFLSGGKGGEANKEAKARFDLACAEIALHRATGDQVTLGCEPRE